MQTWRNSLFSRSNWRIKQHSVLPGFGITMGLSLLYVTLLLLIPLGGLILTATSMSISEFWEKGIADTRVLAAYRLSFLASFAGASINALFGFIVAWVLVRYSFPGKRIIDALVDLPFALPTAVSGIALTTLYAKTGWIGKWFDLVGIQIAYSWAGIVLTLTLIGLPFVVRTVQPALEEMEVELEEAAASLGATRWKTFWRVIFPTVLPALLTGFTLAFARALGEYGSIIFIAGNMPGKTEIAPLLVVIRLEQYDYAGATAISVVLLLVAFMMLFTINGMQWWSRRYDS